MAQIEKHGVLVTGAAGGIGSVIVDRLATRSEVVIATDQAHAIGKLAVAHGNIRPVACDITAPDEVEALTAMCQQEGIDTVVHSAGYGGPFVKVAEVPYDDWRKVFGVNVDSLYLIAHNLLPSMVKQKYGRIVAISSIQGSFGSKGSSAYVASKHAVNGLVKTIAAEYGEYGVTANAICPGYIRTPMGADNARVDAYTQRVLDRTPSKSIGEPIQVADLVEFLLRDSSSYMNGSLITLDGGISADIGIL